ncbi:MAG: disulfide bond formation protein DsbA [Proteobacteria bacterium]|nr:disulfide bond formation protein DsbA [Pseudomonadota bacterium]
MKVTYYLEAISSWCYWAEPMWADLKRRHAGQPVHFDWKIALMNETGLPTSRAQLEWFYRRSGPMVRSPFMLNSGWYEPGLKEYLAPNLVAEAARSLGVTDDHVRLALAHAAMREGQRVADWQVSITVAAQAAALDPVVLLARAQSDEVRRVVEASTAEFHALNVSQRPVFLLQNNIGDRAVISGLVKLEPLAATIDALMADAAAYESHAAHFGSPPEV